MYFLSMHTDSQDCLSLISYRQVVECVPGSACVVVKKNMTNLEHYVIGAEEFRDDIRLIMVDDEWRNSWWKSKHETLKDWLMAEYKPYKLTRFEYDLLEVIKRSLGDEVEQILLLKEMNKRGYFKGYFNELDTYVRINIDNILANSEVISDD